MRIIAGAYKGRRLEGPPATGTRPTSDRLRETLFNVLMTRIPGARVLDGFAGTGALGLEALSRGARHAVLVERDPRALRVIERNVATCGAATACTIVRSDVLAFMRRRAGSAGFDLVLLDPPYDMADRDLTALLTGAREVLAPGAVVVLEHSRRRPAPSAVPGLTLRRSVTAGDSVLALYEAGHPEADRGA